MMEIKIKMVNRTDMITAIHTKIALAGQFPQSANKATEWFSACELKQVRHKPEIKRDKQTNKPQVNDGAIKLED